VIAAIFGSTVGYPSDSLASRYIMLGLYVTGTEAQWACGRDEWVSWYWRDRSCDGM